MITAKEYNVTTDENRMNVYVLQAPVLPDVAVLSFTMSKTIVGQGYSLAANITVENQGADAESFNLTVSANTTTVCSQIIVLEGGNSTEVTVVWNTTGSGMGNYAMSAYAEPLTGEIDTADNSLIGETVHIGVLGDVNADGKVDMRDIGYVARRFMMSPSDLLWDPNSDINGDGKVDMKDIGATARNFGEHY